MPQLVDAEVLSKYLYIITGILTSLLTQLGYDPVETPSVALQYNYPFPEIARWHAIANGNFPRDFYFGVVTSENAWNIDSPDMAVQNVAFAREYAQIESYDIREINAKSRLKYREDIRLAKSMGVTMMQITLSWPRILPDGYSSKINEREIEFYSEVIDEMLANGIKPMVSLSSGQVPENFARLGGWSNSLIVEHFVNYARVAFTAFSDRVEYWATISQPGHMCVTNYGDVSIPIANKTARAEYVCGHHMLLSHARVYRLYHEEFYSINNGKVGIFLRYTWFERKSTAVTVDVVERAYQFHNNWLTHPILSSTGDYPVAMKERIASVSYRQGFARSRLPTFESSEINEIKGSIDFLGINYFTSTQIEETEVNVDRVSYENDIGIRKLPPNNEWPGELEIKNTPWGLSNLLERLDNDYNLPKVFITANGYADTGKIEDLDRVVYLHQHLHSVLRAVQMNIDISGYFVWTLTDEMSVDTRDQSRYGLIHVDFNSRNLTRTKKTSYEIMADIYHSKVIKNITEIVGERRAYEAKTYWVSKF